MAKIKDLAKLIANTLESYTDDVKEEMVRAQDDLSKESVALLQSDSPKDTEEYSKSWRRMKTKTGYVIYNADHYRLTHVLENGHVKRGGGRVAARVHIAPVEQRAVDAFEKRVEKAIKT